MKNYKTSLHHILTISILMTFFLYPSQDADLGWHLRYGQSYLQRHNINTPNDFSYQLPDYHWPNHAWLTDIATYSLFHFGGLTLLSVSAAIVITVSFWLMLRKDINVASYALIPILYFGSHLLNLGMRSQLISLLATSILWSSLYRHPSKQNLKYIPLLFLFWANLHGQFIFGLGIFLLFLLSHRFESIHQKRLYWWTFLLSSLATIINPYGLRLHHVAVEHLRAGQIIDIHEWTPWELTSVRSIVLMIYALFIWIPIIKSKQKIHRSQITILAGLTLGSFLARRIIPFFLLISLPILLKQIKKLPSHGLAKILPKWSLFLGVVLLLTSLAILKDKSILTQNWDTYCSQHLRCSTQLIKFMKQRSIRGKIFNSYRLGGFLIWHSPQVPVYIDGRMTLWKDAQGDYLYPKYQQFIHMGSGWQRYLYQENFDYLILQPQYPLAQGMQDLGWPKVYQDEYVWMFANPSQPGQW